MIPGLILFGLLVSSPAPLGGSDLVPREVPKEDLSLKDASAPPSDRGQALLGEADNARRTAESSLWRSLTLLSMAARTPGVDPAAVKSRFADLAHKGWIPAWYWVGQCHEQGWGTPVDPAAARVWFEKGAEAGDSDCLLHLAWLLEEGKGGAADTARAHQLRVRAGSPDLTTTPAGAPVAAEVPAKDSRSGAPDANPVRPKYQPPPPAYPPLAKLARIQGTVVVQVAIGPDGVPMGVKATSGPAQLRPTAEAYAAQWRFHPSRVNGRYTATTFTIPFTLR